MTWWQIVAACLGGSWASWKLLIEQFIHPPWTVQVVGSDRGVYSSSKGITLVLKRRFRDGDYAKNKIAIGSLAMDDEDFDEKLLDLRDRAKERAKRLNKIEGVVKKS